MSRDIATITGSDLVAAKITPAFFLDMDFDAGSVYLWTGYNDLVAGSKTYVGAGTFLTVSEVEETAEIAVRGATFTLNGMDPTILSLALSEPYQGRRARLYIGLLPIADENDLVEIFSGYMDQLPIDEGTDAVTVSMSVENKLIDLERPRGGRFTSAYQRSLYPGDAGLDFVEDMQDKQVPWGRNAASG